MANILIIDDDPISVEIIKLALNEAGHHIFETDDGNQGLEIYSKNDIDVVITDIYMPKKDGLELIQEFKKDYPNIKIIAISGGFINPDESALVLQIANEFGAFHVLEKPIEPDELLEAVQKLLS